MGRSRSAFSLVEILVVLGVVATLSLMLMSGMSQAGKRARSIKCLNNLRQIGSAAMQFAANSNGQLPMSQHQNEHGLGISWYASLGDYLDAPKDSFGNYVKSPEIFKCPVYPQKQRPYTYAINDFLTPYPYGAEQVNYSRLPALPQPSSTLLFAECNEKYSASDHFHFADGDVGYSSSAFASQIAVERHGKAANYLFADGHAESLAWTTVQTELQKSGSRFIHP